MVHHAEPLGRMQKASVRGLDAGSWERAPAPPPVPSARARLASRRVHRGARAGVAGTRRRQIAAAAVADHHIVNASRTRSCGCCASRWGCAPRLTARRRPRSPRSSPRCSGTMVRRRRWRRAASVAAGQLADARSPPARARGDLESLRTARRLTPAAAHLAGCLPDAAASSTSATARAKPSLELRRSERGLRRAVVRRGARRARRRRRRRHDVRERAPLRGLRPRVGLAAQPDVDAVGALLSTHPRVATRPT